MLEGVSGNGQMPRARRRAENAARAAERYAEKLARQIAAYAPHDGSFALRIPELHVSRMSGISQACVHGLRLPCLSIIAQGAKTVIVG